MKAMFTSIRNYVSSSSSSSSSRHHHHPLDARSAQRSVASTFTHPDVIALDYTPLSAATAALQQAEHEKLVRKAAAWMWYMRGNSKIFNAEPCVAKMKYWSSPPADRCRLRGSSCPRSASRFQIEATSRLQQPASHDIYTAAPRTTKTNPASDKISKRVAAASESFYSHDRLTCALSAAPAILNRPTRDSDSASCKYSSIQARYNPHSQRRSYPTFVDVAWRRPLGSHDYELSSTHDHVRQLGRLQRCSNHDATDRFEQQINGATTLQTNHICGSAVKAAAHHHDVCLIVNDSSCSWCTAAAVEAHCHDDGSSNYSPTAITLLQAFISSDHSFPEWEGCQYGICVGEELVSAARLKAECYYKTESVVKVTATAEEATNKRRCGPVSMWALQRRHFASGLKKFQHRRRY